MPDVDLQKEILAVQGPRGLVGISINRSRVLWLHSVHCFSRFFGTNSRLHSMPFHRSITFYSRGVFGAHAFVETSGVGLKT